MKIVRGKTPYLMDAISVLSVRKLFDDNAECKFDFNCVSKKLTILDNYKTQQDYMYGKEYRVEYLPDLQYIREEKIKEILE